jgi:DNA-binding LytR/AlgR family response regulator
MASSVSVGRQGLAKAPGRAKVARGFRRGGWDERGGDVTSGERSGTSGIFWRAVPIFGATVIALNTVNALTEMQDDPATPWIYPVVSQATSAVMVIVALWIPWLAYRAAPLEGRPLWRILAIHAVGLLAFAAFHVVGFYLLRMLTFRLLDLPYDYDLAGRFIYELRKDAIGYLIGTVAFWAMTRIYREPEPAPSPATFDIRDGGKLVRAPVADILAVSSAGNYVEFVLADGRRPLMRTPLSAIEAELAPRGFVRTHRSWLVNAARVTELRPEKSGDYAVRLGDLEAPLSRRFPEALARLRAG